jgi:hypothetical protein
MKQQAVSSHNGTASFSVAKPGYSGWGRMSSIPSHNTRDEISVESTTLDKMFHELEGRVFPPGAIKIDVEGHEMDVIEGAAEIISAFRPLILIEIGHTFATNPRIVAQYLQKWNYTPYFADGSVVQEYQMKATGAFNAFFIANKQ